MGLKLNLGAGTNHQPAPWVNVDRVGSTNPDEVCDLEGQWPWADNSVSEVVFNHSLEHMAGWEKVFQELWRVCEDGAKVHIVVPCVRHDDWLNDPTHVFRVTPEMLALLSRKACAQFRAARAANSQLADYIGVDFELISAEQVLDPAFAHLQNDPAIYDLIRTRWNVIKEIKMVMKAVKEPK